VTQQLADHRQALAKRGGHAGFGPTVMSWLAPNVYSPAANVAREVAEPLLSPARRILPPLGGLDLSPMITVAVLLVIQSFVLGTLLPVRVWAG